jgi:hypothetical protein
MQTKRLLVWVISALIGAGVTAFIVYAHIPIPDPGNPAGDPLFHLGFGVDAYRFAYSNVALLFLSLGATAFIWLDYFFDTKYLKS